MNATLVLAERLDLPAVRPLACDLLARAGCDLTLDAGRVGHLGALALQLLIAAARRWRADGVRLAIEPRSPSFDDALRVFGVDPALLAPGGGGAAAWT